MNAKMAIGLRVSESRIHGKGCFAVIPFRQNERIAEYVGERIPLAEADRRRCTSRKQCICDVDGEWAIDGSRGGNGTQYINHSCQPNSDVIVSRGKIFLYALREIIPGEEITADYFYELGLTGIRCNCRTSSCGETIDPEAIKASEINRSDSDSAIQLT